MMALWAESAMLFFTYALAPSSAPVTPVPGVVPRWVWTSDSGMPSVAAMSSGPCPAFPMSLTIFLVITPSGWPCTYASVFGSTVLLT
jgi:hypothetical protein